MAARLKSITDPHYLYEVRGKPVEGNNYVESLSHQKVPKIAAPTYKSWGELLTFLMKENLPGAYPYTGGVYPYRRTGEDPTRMFAGEGTPERTNRRFHYLSQGQKSARLSTAFDSVTLYGEDPHPRPDIYGKIGNSGVNIPTLDDMKKLYSGFDLSVAEHVGVDDDQRPRADHPRDVHEHRGRPAGREIPARRPGALGRSAREDRETVRRTQAPALRRRRCRRATTASASACSASPATSSSMPKPTRRSRRRHCRPCAAPCRPTSSRKTRRRTPASSRTEFALRMMGDIQQYFVDHKVRNFYSVSISGYHIAEAGANPISQLAFTLCNGFTIVEYYLARGMKIDDFAPNLSFFFSQRHGPGVQRHRPRRAAHLGARDARALRRQRRAAR